MKINLNFTLRKQFYINNLAYGMLEITYEILPCELFKSQKINLFFFSVYIHRTKYLQCVI